MKRWSVTPLATWNSQSGDSGPGRHPVSSSTSRRRGGGPVLAGLDAPGRDLPAEQIGDEAVAPEEQDAAVGVVDDGAGGVVRRAHHVVPEAVTAGQLHVGQAEAHPRALVQ